MEYRTRGMLPGCRLPVDLWHRQLLGLLQGSRCTWQPMHLSACCAGPPQAGHAVGAGPCTLLMVLEPYAGIGFLGFFWYLQRVVQLLELKDEGLAGGDHHVPAAATCLEGGGVGRPGGPSRQGG